MQAAGGAVMEIWKPIPDFQGYEASSLGRIRSRHLRILSLRKNNCGYLVVYPYRDGKKFTCGVHRLVCAAFFGKIPKCMEVNHKNAVKHDNVISNLEICTPKENHAHMKRMCLRKRSGLGVIVPDEDRAVIRFFYKKQTGKGSFVTKTLAKVFQTSRQTVSRIGNGRCP